MKVFGSIVGLVCFGLGFLFLLPEKKLKPSGSGEVSQLTYKKASKPSRSIFTKVDDSSYDPIPEKLYLNEEELNEGDSTLIATLNRPNTTTQDDVRLIKTVFSHYRSVFKENPVGVHEEMIALLGGKNSQGITYLPKSHPALVNGKLHDRWGTPFYFHQLSDHAIEIRSAGPDGQHWNADDIIIR